MLSVLSLSAVSLAIVPLGSSSASAAAEDSLDSVIGVMSQPFNVLSPSTGRFALKISTRAASTRQARLEFLLHRRVSGRGPFRAIADGNVATRVIDSVSLTLSRVPRDNSGLFSPSIALRTTGSTPSSLTLPFVGVYPLTVRVMNANGAVLASTMTFLNRRDPESVGAPVQISTLMRIAGPPSLTTDGLVEISDATRDMVRSSIDLLATSAGNITVSIEPELVAALASAVEPRDEQLFKELREQLQRRAITSATFAPVDPSLMAARGLGSEFVEQLKLGEQVLDRFLPGVPIRRTTWLALDKVDDRGIALLERAGINSVILAPGAEVDLPSSKPIGIVSAFRATGRNPMPVIGADPLLSATSSIAQSFPEQAAHRLAAEAVVMRDDLITDGFDTTRVRLLMSTTTGIIPTTSALRAATRILAVTPGFSPTDMTSPNTVGDSDPSISPAPPVDPPRDTVTAALKAARGSLRAVSSMLDADDPQRDTWNFLLGVGASTATPNAVDYLDAVRSSLQSTLNAVSITTPGTINLSSRNGSIRFQVRNNNSQQLTVRIRVSSAKLAIDKPTMVVTLVPGGTTEVAVPAATRTNGRFPITVRVSTPEGNLNVVPLLTITAKVSALAGFGQLVSITLLLVLLAWWWSHRRSARS